VQTRQVLVVIKQLSGPLVIGSETSIISAKSTKEPETQSNKINKNTEYYLHINRNSREVFTGNSNAEIVQ
jgi:hypothetical protein